jgi:hypothetical protein
VTRFCEGTHGREKGLEGPARPAPGLWRGFVRWDSGGPSMERDTVRKLMSHFKIKIIALQPRGKVSPNAGFDQRGCCNATSGNHPPELSEKSGADGEECVSCEQGVVSGLRVGDYGGIECD